MAINVTRDVLEALTPWGIDAPELLTALKVEQRLERRARLATLRAEVDARITAFESDASSPIAAGRRATLAAAWRAIVTTTVPSLFEPGDDEDEKCHI